MTCWIFFIEALKCIILEYSKDLEDKFKDEIMSYPDEVPENIEFVWQSRSMHVMES